jgi:hypothetical protein
MSKSATATDVAEFSTATEKPGALALPANVGGVRQSGA